MFRLRLFYLLCLILLTVCPAFGNQCRVVHVRPATPADTALRTWHLAKAEKLYTAEIEQDPTSEASFSGLILSQLYLGDTDAAIATALDAIKTLPRSATLLANLSEIQFRRADLAASRATLQRALALDPCNPRTFYDTAKYLQASSMYASARDRINSAHRLSPDDPEITEAWLENQPIATRMAVWTKRLQSDDLPAKEKVSVSSELEKLETLKVESERGKCQVISTATSMTLPFSYIMEDAVTIRHLGLDVRINNKATARLQIDTGASGIIIRRGLAAKAGLVPLAHSRFYGIGDDGAQSSYSAIADDLKIGQFEFKNCLVEVSNKRTIADEDGLIGGDVFKDYLLTIDFPEHSIKIDPLPQPPAEPAPQEEALTPRDANATPLRDAYVAPSMKDWTPVLRFGQDLMVPVGLGDSKVHWFLLDTGAYTTILSPATATAVTQVSRNRDIGVAGLSGDVKEVFEARKVELTFAGVRQKLNRAVVFNLDNVTGTQGVAASGLLGYETLQYLVMQIDYRDGLVHFDYDPKHGTNRFSAQ